MAFWYVRPDESLLLAPASGTVATNYDIAWLTSPTVDRPAKGTSGTVSWTLSPSPSVADVSLAALVNHNVSVDAAVSGSVSATIAASSTSPDGIPLNPLVTFTPTTVSSLVVGVTSNPDDVVIGLLYAGQKRVLERQLHTQPEFDEADPFEWQGEFKGLQPFDSGVTSRTLSGDTLVSGTGMADIEAWYRSTKRGTLPTLIVPISEVNDAWLVTFSYRSQPIMVYPSEPSRSIYRVSLVFTELPRVRW